MTTPIAELMPLIREALDSGTAVRLAVSGASMWPFIKAGDVVTLEPSQSSPPRVGDIMLVQWEDGHYVLHRAVRREGCAILFAGDNCGQREGPFPPTQLIARAVSVTRGEKTWRVDRGFPRVSGLAWIALTPARPILLRLALRAHHLLKLGASRPLCPHQ